MRCRLTRLLRSPQVLTAGSHAATLHLQDFSVVFDFLFLSVPADTQPTPKLPHIEAIP
jgi:hypothetical protein